MPTLILLRHAKSSWDQPGQADADRPLAPRGRKAAPSIGAWLRRHDLLPDLVLCSTARRTRETFDLVQGEWQQPVETRELDSLYLATPERLVGILHGLGEGPERVLVIGHNPGLHELSLRLAGDGRAADLARLHEKFPTGALAVLRFAGSWAELAPGTARLDAFVLPRELGHVR